MTRRILAGVMAVGMVAGLCEIAGAQDRPDRGDWRERAQEMRERQQDGEGRRQWDPEQMRARISERLKEQLGATDEEWEVLGPRIERVQQLRQSQAAGPAAGLAMMGRGGPGGPGGRGGDAAARFARPGEQPGEVAQLTQDLRATLNDENASPEQIREKLAALRSAREKSRAELATAQQELRDLLTQRQEATLVMMGLLD